MATERSTSAVVHCASWLGKALNEGAALNDGLSDGEVLGAWVAHTPPQARAPSQFSHAFSTQKGLQGKTVQKGNNCPTASSQTAKSQPVSLLASKQLELQSDVGAALDVGSLEGAALDVGWLEGEVLGTRLGGVLKEGAALSVGMLEGAELKDGPSDGEVLGASVAQTPPQARAPSQLAHASLTHPGSHAMSVQKLSKDSTVASQAGKLQPPPSSVTSFLYSKQLELQK